MDVVEFVVVLIDEVLLFILVFFVFGVGEVVGIVVFCVGYCDGDFFGGRCVGIVCGGVLGCCGGFWRYFGLGFVN